MDPTSIGGARDCSVRRSRTCGSSGCMQDVGVPVGFWRSVGRPRTRFIVESFIDELAHAGRRGPVRVPPRAARQAPRHKARARAGGDKAGWGTPLPAGRARGIAVASRTRATRRTWPRCRSRRRRRAGPPPRLRDRLRDRGQPGPGQGADGRRRRLRDDRRAVRPDHARGRPRPADQLPQLPDDAHHRDARDRGAHPRFGPGRPGRRSASPACRRSRPPSATRSSPPRASGYDRCRSSRRC